MPYPLRAVAAVTALGLAGATVWALGGDDPVPAPGVVDLGSIQAISLSTKQSCSDLLDYYRTEASKVVGPYGLYANRLFKEGGGLAEASAARPAAGGVATDSVTTPDSATNVQVAGVDESDFVKTSGDLMVSVVNGKVQVSRLDGGATKVLSTWAPVRSFPQSVLLEGSIAVIIGDRSEEENPAARIADPGIVPASTPVAVLTVLDLSDPAEPRPVRRLEVDGQRSGDARLVDGELRFAVTAGVRGINWKNPVYPKPRENEDPAKAQAKYELAEKRAVAANRTLVEASKIENWLPQATVTELNAASKPTGKAVSQTLMDCAQVSVPGTFSGLETLAMISVDLKAATPLTTWRSAGVVASGSTVYANVDHTWIATSQWDAVPTDVQTTIGGRFAPVAATTQVHRFDTARGQVPAYVASGTIEGTLLSQFAMDEKDGFLRLASTSESPQPTGDDEPSVTDDPEVTESAVSESWSTPQVPPAPLPGESSAPEVGPDGSSSGAASSSGDVLEKGVAGGDASDSVGGSVASKIAPVRSRSEARVSVLALEGKQVKQVGLVTGLGVGEQIRGVRFVGDVGYVVTYRQTDPLYTVDLSDPTSPRVRGELKMLGYSAYLHPLGAGRLLGLGQDGTAEGRTTGLQMSLFDTSDVSSPRRIDQVALPATWSDAESDHHAFTLVGDLALVPYTEWGSTTSKSSTAPERVVARSQFDTGVIAVRIGKDAIGEPITLRPIADGRLTFDSSKELKKPIQKVVEAMPMRTVVHDGAIYTLTIAGVAVHDAQSFERLAFVDF